MRNAQVIRLKNDINFSETLCKQPHEKNPYFYDYNNNNNTFKNFHIKT